MSMEVEEISAAASSPSSRSPQSQFIRENFDILETIGIGGFGKVYKVQHCLDEQIYALKKVRISGDPNRRKDVKREVKHLAKLVHKNIVKYFFSWMLKDYSNSPSSSQGSFEYNESSSSDPGDKLAAAFSAGVNERKLELERIEAANHAALADDADVSMNADADVSMNLAPDLVPFVFIQMEFCTTTLKQCIEENRFTTRDEVGKIISQIMAGLDYIHSKNILHRDLKPDNIFLTEDGVVKIGDFGLSRPFPNNEQDHLTGDLGSDLYMAPEVKTGKQYLSGCDLYSLGIIYFEMIRPTFTTLSEKYTVIGNLKKEEILFPENWPIKDWERETKHVKGLLDHNPEKRKLMGYELNTAGSHSGVPREPRGSTNRFRAKPYTRNSGSDGRKAFSCKKSTSND